MKTSAEKETQMKKTGWAARELGLNPATLRMKVKAGEIPAVRFGKHLRFQVEAIREYIANCRTDTTQN